MAHNDIAESADVAWLAFQRKVLLPNSLTEEQIEFLRGVFRYGFGCGFQAGARAMGAATQKLIKEAS